MGLYLYNGGLLTNSGKLAADMDCCCNAGVDCSECSSCTPATLSLDFNSISLDCCSTWIFPDADEGVFADGNVGVNDTFVLNQDEAAPCQYCLDGVAGDLLFKENSAGDCSGSVVDTFDCRHRIAAKFTAGITGPVLNVVFWVEVTETVTVWRFLLFGGSSGDLADCQPLTNLVINNDYTACEITRTPGAICGLPASALNAGKNGSVTVNASC